MIFVMIIIIISLKSWFCQTAHTVIENGRFGWVKQLMSDVPIFRRKNSDFRFLCLVVYQN